MSVLFAIAILGPLGVLAGIAAARMAPLGTLAPVTFIRLPIAMGLGAAVFGEMPTTWAIIGAAAILVANAFTWSRGKPYT